MNLYFDNAATTSMHPEVLNAMLPFLKEDFGNASSIHSYGRKARVAIEESRELIADFIGANPSEIYFTSGGTEANNFIINGIAKSNFIETKKNGIITSPIEHKATLDSISYLTENGFYKTFLNVLPDGSIAEATIQNSIKAETSLVAIMHTNNEIGTINDIRKISEQLGNGQYFFCDAVQAFGKISINVNKLGIHALSASAHKIHGPKGIGIAYVKSGTPLSPLLFGGAQERNRRGGTENVAAIVGFAEAVRIAAKNMDNNYKHVKTIQTYFEKNIFDYFGKKIELNGGKNRTPYISNLTFKSDFFNNNIDTLLMTLDINGIAASQGSACTSGTIKRSHVIENLGKRDPDSDGTIRFSFSILNTKKEIDKLLEVLINIGNKNLKK